MSKVVFEVTGGKDAVRAFEKALKHPAQQSFDYSPAFKFWRAVHYVAGYCSVSGLGFMFACLFLGATQYLLPLAFWMVGCAIVSISTKPNALKNGGF